MEVQLNVAGNQAVILKPAIYRGKKSGCHQKLGYEEGQGRLVLKTERWRPLSGI